MTEYTATAGAALARWRSENPNAETAASRNPAERWHDQDTRKSAIDAFCWQCMGGTIDAANGARANIRDCPSSSASVNPCPLWAWRPYK